jgi:Spy/CpxP family protein refolding chaperone
MNYRWSSVLILGTLLALPLGAVRADESGAPSAGDGEAHHWMHGGGHGHNDLGITKDQMAKLKSIMEAQKMALKPLWRKQRDLTTKLSDQVEDKASDSDIQHTLADLKENREAMKTESKRFGDQREAILTPTQRARMMLAHRFGRGPWGHESMDHRGGDWHKEDMDGHHHHGDDNDRADNYGGDHDDGGQEM